MTASLSFTAISTGRIQSLALATVGTAWEWGWNPNTVTAPMHIPTKVNMPPGVRFTSPAAGSEVGHSSWCRPPNPV